MSTPIVRSRAGRARSAVCGISLERALELFDARWRPRVAAIAARHTRLADLAISFPALLFALAIPRPGFEAEPVIAGVIGGMALRDVAAKAGVPMWLRKLPPQTFATRLAPLPDGELLRLRIVNHLPRAKRAAFWLAAVSEAARWGDDRFIVWVAREAASAKRPLPVDDIRRSALLAFYSHFEGSTGRRFIGTRWSADMCFANARTASTAFLTRAELYLYIGETGLAHTWLQPGQVDGYEFEPLDTASRIAEEGKIMSNCVDTYGYRIARGSARLWSVRREGVRIATLEVSSLKPVPVIRDVRAAKNATCEREVWWAAMRWLASHDLAGIVTASAPWGDAEFHRRWIELWRPYWVARRRLPEWLPLRYLRGSILII